MHFKSKVGTGWSGRALNRPVVRLYYPTHCVKISSRSRNAFASYKENIFFLICILRTADNGQRTTDNELQTNIYPHFILLIRNCHVMKREENIFLG